MSELLLYNNTLASLLVLITRPSMFIPFEPVFVKVNELPSEFIRPVVSTRSCPALLVNLAAPLLFVTFPETTKPPEPLLVIVKSPELTTFPLTNSPSAPLLSASKIPFVFMMFPEIFIPLSPVFFISMLPSFAKFLTCPEIVVPPSFP